MRAYALVGTTTMFGSLVGDTNQCWLFWVDHQPATVASASNQPLAGARASQQTKVYMACSSYQNKVRSLSYPLHPSLSLATRIHLYHFDCYLCVDFVQ